MYFTIIIKTIIIIIYDTISKEVDTSKIDQFGHF